MTKTYTCDRCGVTEDNNGPWLDLNFAGMIKRYDDDKGGRFDVDLCMECKDNLEKWFNEKGK